MLVLVVVVLVVVVLVLVVVVLVLVVVVVVAADIVVALDGEPPEMRSTDATGAPPQATVSITNAAAGGTSLSTEAD